MPFLSLFYLPRPLPPQPFSLRLRSSPRLHAVAGCLRESDGTEIHRREQGEVPGSKRTLLMTVSGVECVCVPQSKSLTAPNLTTLVRGASLDGFKPAGLFKKRTSGDGSNHLKSSTTLGGYAPSSLLVVAGGVTAAAAAAALLLSRSKFRA